MNVKVVSSFAAAIADSNKAILKASKNTVNIVAAIARKNAMKNIQDNFTLRNNFTVNSVRFTQCPPGAARLQDVKSQVGITERAGYMERQEKAAPKLPEAKTLSFRQQKLAAAQTPEKSAKNITIRKWPKTLSTARPNSKAIKRGQSPKPPSRPKQKNSYAAMTRFSPCQISERPRVASAFACPKF